MLRISFLVFFAIGLLAPFFSHSNDFLCPLEPVHSGTYSPPLMNWNSPPMYRAQINRSRFEQWASPALHGRQRDSNWCWAAAVQMALNHRGFFVQQEQIVALIKGSLLNEGGSLEEMSRAFNRWTLDLGDVRIVLGRAVFPTPELIVQELNQDFPLVVGLINQLNNPSAGYHAYVLTGVNYIIDERGKILIFNVSLRDPWPMNPSEIDLQGEDFFERLIGTVQIIESRGRTHF